MSADQSNPTYLRERIGKLYTALDLERSMVEDAEAERDRLDALGSELVEALNEAITAGYDPPRRLEDARAKWIYRNEASRAA